MLRMLWSKEQVVAIEKRAEAAELPHARLLEAAGAHRTTWARWKRGKGSPTVAAWAQVVALVREYEAKKADGAPQAPAANDPAAVAA